MPAVAPRADERDLVEHYFDQPWSDGLPVVPPTPDRIAAVLDVLGGHPKELVARIPPRWGNLTRELLAVNMVMAGCKPEYAPVVRAAILALVAVQQKSSSRAGAARHYQQGRAGWQF